MLHDPAFWVSAAFVIFIGVALYLKAPALIAARLDERADGIRKQLDEARELREEAQALLANYQRKQLEAEEEAKGIVEQAKREAEQIATKAAEATEALVERRTRMAEEKIAQAEAQALKDVRDQAINLATDAARQILIDTVAKDRSDDLVGEAIGELADNLQ